MHLPRANRHSSLQSSKQNPKPKFKSRKSAATCCETDRFLKHDRTKKLVNLFQVITQRASTQIHYYTQTIDLLGSKFGPKVSRLISKCAGKPI
jgi:hypothetical protein